jgi:hypothetical protein
MANHDKTGLIETLKNMSPEEFHFQLPLYGDFDLEKEEIAKRIYELLSFEKTLDLYCVHCKKNSVFQVSNALEDNTIIPSWTTRNNGLIIFSCYCSRDNEHQYESYYYKIESHLCKVGQTPSVADISIPEMEKYKPVLKEEKYKEFLRGIGLSSHDIGIGAFVYFRRVIEYLIDEASIKAASIDKEFDEKGYSELRIREKISLLKDFLPEYLVENTFIYKILSSGIHELNEKECKQILPALQNSIEMILEEKLSERTKELREKETKKTLQSFAKSQSSK